MMVYYVTGCVFQGYKVCCALLDTPWAFGDWWRLGIIDLSHNAILSNIINIAHSHGLLWGDWWVCCSINVMLHNDMTSRCNNRLLRGEPQGTSRDKWQQGWMNNTLSFCRHDKLVYSGSSMSAQLMWTVEYKRNDHLILCSRGFPCMSDISQTRKLTSPPGWCH